jgi:MFS family permease
VLPVSMLLGTMMRVQILGVALAGFFLSRWPSAMLVATLAFLFLFGLFSGPQRVAFQLLLAKVIPISRRGRLQAWRNVTGGVVASGLAFMAGRYVIEKNLFGNGYATTFLLAFVLTSLGLTALRLLLLEPESPTIRTKATVRERLKDFPAMIMGDRNFLFFLIVQLLAAAGRISAPFFILFAGQTIPLTGENIGLLSLAFLGADTATNLVWGYAGDKFGFRSTFIGSLALWIASIVALLMADNLALVFLAYFGLGAAQGGWMMSASTMVLEFGLREDIAMRLAVLTTLEGVMSAAGPIIGGIVAASLGYPVLFGISIGFLATALVLLTVVVREPRRRRSHT